MSIDTEINEIRVKNGEIKRFVGTEQTMTIEEVVELLNQQSQEIERKEKVLENFCEIRDRIGDRFYDYSKTWGMY